MRLGRWTARLPRPSLPGRSGLDLGRFRRRGTSEAERAVTPLRPRSEDAATGEARRARRRRTARVVGVAGTSAVLLTALAVGVFPTRTWLDQRAGIAEAEQRLEVLRDQNAAFEQRIARLDRDEEIERLAREQYNLVLPGEEAYAVLPAPLPPVELPPLWPFGPLSD